MTHVCCPTCRLRFTRATAAYLMLCPECGEEPVPMPSVLGFQLFSDDDPSDAPAQAVAVALPVTPFAPTTS